jgi:GntR family transcriptional regulator
MTRLRLLDNEPVMLEDIWLDHSNFKSFMDMQEDEIGPLLYPIYDSHFGQIVIRAKESLMVESAEDSTAKILRIATQAPIIVIDRTAFGLDGRPIEWRRSRALADHFSYNVEIN